MRFFEGHRPTFIVMVVLAALAAALSGCGSTASSARQKEVIVEVHDAWSMPQSVLSQFTKKTGYKVKIVTHDGVAQLADSVALNAGSPEGDVVYGLDNSYASRATRAGAVASYTPADQPAESKRYALPGAAGSQLTATDYGDVCVNADDSWFAAHHLAAPKTFDDLLKPQYKNLLAIPAASSSSTGLAWLVGTISAKGSGWRSYWKALLKNGAKIDSGWTQAYDGDFTGGGKGTYPLVISYSTSPPYTIPTGKTKPTTSALLDTCFRQVEYVGVLAGAPNQAGAKAFVDFMVGREVQQALPENMYMDPVNTSVSVPALWQRWAPLSKNPWPMSQATIAANRDSWVTQWREIVRAG